jgi:type I restriction enzyme, R subunit
MQQHILPRWQAKLAQVQAAAMQKDAELTSAQDSTLLETRLQVSERLRQQAAWIEQSRIDLIISEGQNIDGKLDAKGANPG